MSLEFNQIKKSIESSLNILNIKKVIYVDDAFAEEFSLDEVTGTIEYLIRNKGSEIFSENNALKSIEFDVPDPYVWKLDVSELWESFKVEQKRNLISWLNRKSNEEVTAEEIEDIFVSAKIQEILPSDFDYFQLSPSQWVNQKTDLLSGASEDNRILCFFDQELKYDQEYESQRNGIALIKEISSTKNENIICTLITHLTPIESEIEFWKSMSNDHALKLSEFLTLSKSRVFSQVDLAAGIRLTLLNHKCETLKEFAVDITKKANDFASSQLENINVYDFYHMVLKSSEKEGIWEAQTLFRIHNIFQELESQKLALISENRRKINENINLLRGLIGKGKIETSSLSWEIRRKELFYDEDLNKLNLPLQNGDIFYFEQSDKYFILLAQPCDLMIRKNGNRKLKVGILAEIVYETPNENENDSIKPIHYFDSTTRSSTYVKLKSTISIDLDILDLSVYNDSGKAIYHSGQDITSFHKPLQNRFLKIKSKMEQKKDKCIELNTLVENSNIEPTKINELIDAVLFQAFNLDKNLVNVDIKDNEIGFNIFRKGTYRKPYSDSLLDDYSNYLSRTGDEHDFAINEVENPVPKKEVVKVGN